MLPGMSGLDVVARFETRIRCLLMLTPASEADHVAGLELGADDFVTKPIEPRVLVARIRKQLSRLQVERAPNTGHDNGILDIGSLRLDVSSRSVHVKGQNVPVTTMEFDILEILVREAGTVVKREDLYTRVLGTQYNGIDRGLDVHMSRIRRKLQQVDFDTDVSSPSALWVTFWQIDEILLRRLVFECARCWAAGTWFLPYMRSQVWSEERVRRAGVFLVHELLRRQRPTERLRSLQHSSVDLALISMPDLESRIGRLVPGRGHCVSVVQESHGIYRVSRWEGCFVAGPVNPARPSGVLPIGLFFHCVPANYHRWRRIPGGATARKVERANQALAVGELSVRVDTQNGAQSDELAASQRMAERVETLIKSRRAGSGRIP